MAEQIKSIHVKRFRKFRDNTLTATNQNVLVGANNSGKTSILHALRLFFFAVADSRRQTGGQDGVWKICSRK